MKKTDRAFPRIFWIFSLGLALLPFSTNAVPIRSLLRYAVILAHRNNSGPSAQDAGRHYRTAMNAQDRNGWPKMVGKKVVLALAASSERTGVAMETSDGNSFRRSSVASTAKISEMSPAPIPFQLADGLIYIQASINGSHLLWMMLDTGSSVTVFDESVLKMLGIRFLGEGNVDGPGQGSVQKLAFANHATLMFAGEELGDQTVATLPLEWFSREVGRSTDGFLGSNIFRNYVVEIDYANQVLRFHDPAGYCYSGSGQHLPLQFIWNDIPTVHAEVVAQDGTAIDGVFLVDSGATTAIWLTKGFSEAHPEVLAAQDMIEVPNVAAVGGELSARLGRVSAIRLGGFVVFNPLTQFSQNTSGILANPDLAGIIGAQMLRRFRVVFDYAHGEMVLEPSEHFGDSSD
jgi:aspartyl protease